MLVVSVGSGGAIVGIGRKLKVAVKDCIVVGVDPEGSAVAPLETPNGMKYPKSWELELGHPDRIPPILGKIT